MESRKSVASSVEEDIPIQAGLELFTVSSVPPLFLCIFAHLDSSSRLFEILGFETTTVVGSVQDITLSPPNIDPTSSAGRLARSKLLRAWVELSAWVADYSKRLGRPIIYAINMAHV